MNNTIKYTSGCVYNNIKLGKKRKFVENTRQEYGQNYGENYRRIVKVICFVEFLDKLKNQTKNVTFESCNIIGELNRIMQSSERLYNFIKIIEIKFIINRKIL